MEVIFHSDFYFIFRLVQWINGNKISFWERLWNQIIDLIGEDPFKMYVIWTTIYAAALYWTIGGIFTLMDLTLKPSNLRKFKVQVGTNEPVEINQLLNVIKVVLFNQFVVGVFVSIAIYYSKMSQGFPDKFREIPTTSKFFIDFFVSILLEEIFFYYSHRLFHHKWFYTKFHKQHHEWKSPIAVTAIYCHPVEHVVSNLLVVTIGPLVMTSQMSFIWMWLLLVNLTTLTDHSGYHLPWFISPQKHDYHHLK
jgi:fatty acid hydroxylase domain-containing protein 2